MVFLLRSHPSAGRVFGIVILSNIFVLCGGRLYRFTVNLGCHSGRYGMMIDHQR
jgi:hypothetical protein